MGRFKRAFSPRVDLLLAMLALVGAARDAHAYCRSRTCEFPQKGVPCEYDAATGCSTVGEFVFWRNKCLSFAVDRAGSVADDIAAEDVEQLVASGFQAWSAVRCRGGGSPELAAGSQGTIACGEAEYECSVPEVNSNLVMFRDDFVDTVYGLRVGVIALTTLTANLNTGELFDADIEINSRDEDFELGSSGGAGVGDRRDLSGVINHELGHLLGLSHSLEPGALMQTYYDGTAVPDADDAAGMCAALGSAASDPVCDVPALPPDAGCLGSNTSCRSQRPAEDPGEDGCSWPCRSARAAIAHRLGRSVRVHRVRLPPSASPSSASSWPRNGCRPLNGNRNLPQIHRSTCPSRGPPEPGLPGTANEGTRLDHVAGAAMPPKKADGGGWGLRSPIAKMPVLRHI